MREAETLREEVDVARCHITANSLEVCVCACECVLWGEPHGAFSRSVYSCEWFQTLRPSALYTTTTGRRARWGQGGDVLLVKEHHISF